MQAVLAAAMATHALLAAHPHLYEPLPPSLSSARPFQYSSLTADPLRLSPSLKLATVAAPKPLAVAAETKKAVAVLKGNSNVEGVVTLFQDSDGPTTVKVRVSGLAPGLHGFHLHEYGDTTNGCISTGPHFNPNKMTHGSPKDEVRHAGDLGNIVANSEGVAEANIVDGQVPLGGPNAVIGRAFVVHELEDDLGKGNTKLQTLLSFFYSFFCYGMFSFLSTYAWMLFVCVCVHRGPRTQPDYWKRWGEIGLWCCGVGSS